MTVTAALASSHVSSFASNCVPVLAAIAVASTTAVEGHKVLRAGSKALRAEQVGFYRPHNVVIDARKSLLEHRGLSALSCNVPTPYGSKCSEWQRQSPGSYGSTEALLSADLRIHTLSPVKTLDEQVIREEEEAIEEERKAAQVDCDDDKCEDTHESTLHKEYQYLIVNEGKTIPKRAFWTGDLSNRDLTSKEAESGKRPRSVQPSQQLRVGLAKRDLARKIISSGIEELKESVTADAEIDPRASSMLKDFLAVQPQVSSPHRNDRKPDRKQLCRVVSFLRRHAELAC